MSRNWALDLHEGAQDSWLHLQEGAPRAPRLLGGNKHQFWGRCIYVVRGPLTGPDSFALPPSTKETSPLFFSKINWYWTPTDYQQKIPQLLYNLCSTTHSNAKFSGVSSSLHCVQEFTTAITLFEIKTLLAFTFFHVHCMQQPTRNGSFCIQQQEANPFNKSSQHTEV